MTQPRRGGILYFATQGPGGGDQWRVETLLAGVAATGWPHYDRTRKVRTFLRLAAHLCRVRPSLVVMEGSGVPGGAAVLAARLCCGVPFLLSSGDAVAPFLAQRRALLGAFAYVYERLLYRFCHGFIGWTPYLVGRALTYGARRAMTAANFARPGGDGTGRARLRAELGIGEQDIVFGIAGSLAWSRRYGYCYGMELVSALQRVSRPDVHVLIVGGGDGERHLRQRAGEDLGRRVHLVGAVAADRVAAYLAAMDIASLPQSVDAVGAFRYTAKLSEFLAARLPVVTGQIPLAYDLDDGWLVRLAGDSPWDERYIAALAAYMQRCSPGGVRELAQAVPNVALTPFALERQQRQVRSFVQDLLADLPQRERLAGTLPEAAPHPR